MTTGMEACELIAKYWKEVKGITVEPENIWNYSPKGELSMVFLWYWEAQDYYEDKDGKSDQHVEGKEV